MQMVLGLTGLAGCGKSTVANYLKSKYGFEFLIFSDILKEEANRRGLLKGGESLEESKRILAKLGDDWRREAGKPGIIADALVERMKSGAFSKVVVDGFRSPAEVELFKKQFSTFKLIYVYAPADVRFARRRLEDHMLKREDFDARDEQDIEKKGLGTVVEMADLKLNNSSDFRSLFLQTDQMMRQLV